MSLEILSAPTYELRTSNRRRFRLRIGHRARVFVSEPWLSGIPESEFVLTQDGLRYHLKRDGKLTHTLIYTTLRPHLSAERQRERYYFPVRIVGIEREVEERTAS